eukprot:15127172-Ditylum_brightwellii.AAC.1
MEEVNKDIAQADMESTSVKYGRGMRTRKKPLSYGVMTGKTCKTQQGINNLCYRGTRYALSEIVPSGTMPYEMGAINLNMDTPVQAQTPDKG